MKKILFTLLLTIFFVPNVNALTETECIIDDPLQCFGIAAPSSTKNIFKNEWNNSCGYSNGHFFDYTDYTDSYPYYCNDDFIEVQSDAVYTFTYFDMDTYLPRNSYKYNFLYIFDENFNQVFNTQDWYSPPYNLTIPSNGKYLLHCQYRGKLSVYPIQLELGEITSTDDLTYVAYEEYIEVPDDSEEPIVPDTTLDTFYSIYLDKLSSLTSFTIENKFLLGVLGLILAFIVLEIILNLFRKGGYR